MAEAAEGPDEVEETICGLVVDKPAVGSDLPVGHMPRVVFFRVPQPSGGAGMLLLAWAAEVVTVDAEVVEVRELEELERCALFRGPGI